MIPCVPSLCQGRGRGQRLPTHVLRELNIQQCSGKAEGRDPGRAKLDRGLEWTGVSKSRRASWESGA